MTILKTKADVDTLAELRQRKAQLKAQMQAEETEIKTIWQEVRSDLEPGELAGQALKSMLGFNKKNKNASDDAALNLAGRLSGPLRLVTDVLVRDPKVALLLKLATPLSVAYLPKITRKAKEAIPTKGKLFGALRKGVAGLRKRLKGGDNDE